MAADRTGQVKYRPPGVCTQSDHWLSAQDQIQRTPLPAACSPPLCQLPGVFSVLFFLCCQLSSCCVQGTDITTDTLHETFGQGAKDYGSSQPGGAGQPLVQTPGVEVTVPVQVPQDPLPPPGAPC